MNEMAEKEKVDEEIPKEIQVDISDLDLGGKDGLDEDLGKETPGEGENEWLKDNTTMPVSSHIHTKNKLKGQIGEANDENARLKAENEQLRLAGKPAENKLGPMPKKNDTQSDEEYEADLRKWHDDAATDSISRASLTNNQTVNARDAANTIKEAVNTHYERAGAFVKENGIEEEVYNQADKNVRSAFESVFPGSGNVFADRIISSLQSGSEKAILIVGRNQEKLDKFKSLLVSDRSGLQAAGYLGSIIGQYKKKAKQTSLAPSPVPDIKSGERSTVVPESSLKKMWKAADKSGDTMKAYNIYAKAKTAGVDVTKWR